MSRGEDMTGFVPNIVSARQTSRGARNGRLTQRQPSIEAGFNPRAAKYWENRGPTNIPANLAAIEQTLRRHGVEVFATPTPGVRLIGDYYPGGIISTQGHN